MGIVFDKNNQAWQKFVTDFHFKIIPPHHGGVQRLLGALLLKTYIRKDAVITADRA
jgi:hypothetical protein